MESGAVPTTGQLLTPSQTTALIRADHCLSICGDESALRQLPAGHWIGGTVPCFMGSSGDVATGHLLFVNRIPDTSEIRAYDTTNLHRVCVDAPDNGYTLILIPAFTETHLSFAQNAPGFESMYEKPLVGWIAGVRPDDPGKPEPKVVDGRTLKFETRRALVAHVPLPPTQRARIDIVNQFRQGSGGRIRFPESGFSATRCTVDGKPVAFADYLLGHGIDTRLPLVADYCGAQINVSFKGIDKARRRVDFYAPVFENAEYRIASPVGGSLQASPAATPDTSEEIVFCCNCILNRLYGELESRHTGALTGPMTFGEIAYQLVNQTLVYMTIEG